MKIGNLVRMSYPLNSMDTGIIIEVINGQEVPPVCKVLWSSGTIQKEWTDDIEVINESR